MFYPAAVVVGVTVTVTVTCPRHVEFDELINGMLELIDWAAVEDDVDVIGEFAIAEDVLPGLLIVVVEGVVVIEKEDVGEKDGEEDEELSDTNKAVLETDVEDAKDESEDVSLIVDGF